jgi:hypothetical protein
MSQIWFKYIEQYREATRYHVTTNIIPAIANVQKVRSAESMGQQSLESNDEWQCGNIAKYQLSTKCSEENLAIANTEI